MTQTTSVKIDPKDSKLIQSSSRARLKRFRLSRLKISNKIGSLDARPVQKHTGIFAFELARNSSAIGIHGAVSEIQSRFL